MAGHPARNLSVRRAVSQSGRATCENLQRGSPTAMTSAMPVTARLPPQRSKSMRGRHDNHRRFEVPAAKWVSDATASQRFEPANVRFGSGADITRYLADVRFDPESQQRADMLACPLCAKSGLMHCSKTHRYSIISSGRVRSVAGTAPLGADKSQQSLLTTCGTYESGPLPRLQLTHRAASSPTPRARQLWPLS